MLSSTQTPVRNGSSVHAGCMTPVRVGLAEVLSDPVLGDGGWTAAPSRQATWIALGHAGADPVDVLRGRVLTALLNRDGCPVCGDPTGVRCCEHGADR